MTTNDARPHHRQHASLRDQLDLDLELPADLDHTGHRQPLDPDQTANVILHPLFLLVRVFDNAKPQEGSGCLRYPALNPAESARPEKWTTLGCGGFSWSRARRASGSEMPPARSLGGVASFSTVSTRPRSGL